MKKDGKTSDITWNSPGNSDQKNYYTSKRPRLSNNGTDSIKSSLTQKSKYSSSSKLTKSQLFGTLSRRAGQ